MEYTLAAAALVAFVAGMLRGAVGFGSALVLVPVLSALYDPMRAVSLVLVLECLVSLPLAPAAFRQAAFRDVGLLLVFAMIGAIPGIYVLNTADPSLLRLLVSGIAILFAGMFLVITPLQRRGLDLPRWLAGIFSGFFGGLGALTGPPVVLHFMLRNVPPHSIRANLIVYFIVIDLVLLVAALASLNQLTEMIIPTAVTLVAIITGAMIGQRIALGGDMPWYRPVAVTVIAITAGASLFL